MPVEETLEQVIIRWENEHITIEQVIGRILVRLQAHEKQLLKLEATQSRLVSDNRRRNKKQ